MIQRLYVQNYILIDSLEVNFNKGLTIITGETGAGKSILLGALSLILGSRADSQALLIKQKKCIIEGEFNITSYNLKDFFYEKELDYDASAIIRREITPEGKSRAFINNTPVNLNTLKELAARLVDIHSQHENLTLSNSSFQLSILDAYADHEKDLIKYKTLYKHYVKQCLHLNTLVYEDKSARAESDYLQYQFNELESTSLKAGEKQALEMELKSLNNAEHIKASLAKIYQVLNENENNILQQLHSSASLMDSIGKFNIKISELALRMQNNYTDLKDVAAELETLQEEINYDPQKAEIINERLNIIYKLEQRHKVNSIDELLKIQQDLSDRLSHFNNLESEIKKLTAESETAKAGLTALALKISKSRKHAAAKIEKEIKKLLADTGMTDAALKIEFYDTGSTPGITGIDRITYLFSANKGIPHMELAKIASGGELSRVMLCLKAMIARLSAMPTIIFDEIDAGISGEIAIKVSNIIKKISAAHQVIAITHLPQMASKGDAHYFVFKEDNKDTTSTKVKELSSNERINEIAKMLSGEKPSTVALENAKELLNR